MKLSVCYKEGTYFFYNLRVEEAFLNMSENPEAIKAKTARSILEGTTSVFVTTAP